jgi:hypothetical protein
MPTLDPVKNKAASDVSTGYDASATSIVLATSGGALFPAPATDGAFNVIWWNNTDYKNPLDDPNFEIVRVTARSTDTLTVTRAQESTSAATHNTGGKTYRMALVPTQKFRDDIETSLNLKTIIKSKSANETDIAESLQNDNHLFFSIGANEVWAGHILFYVTGQSNGVDGEGYYHVAMGLGFTVPSGATYTYDANGTYTDNVTGSTNTQIIGGQTSPNTIGIASNGNVDNCSGQSVTVVNFTITNGSNAGTVYWAWNAAIGSGGAGTITVYKGATMIVGKVS